MEGEASLPLFSPEIMVMNPSFRPAVPLLPPITLFHGMADFSIPYEASVTFGEALQLVGAKVSTILYPDKTHTDLFLQVLALTLRPSLLIGLCVLVVRNFPIMQTLQAHPLLFCCSPQSEFYSTRSFELLGKGVKSWLFTMRECNYSL
jgi:hypothetical protein